MATRRRTTTKVEVPVPPTSNGSPNTMKTPFDAASSTGSPFLPTTPEAILLSIYPATLLLGSLFSTVHPASRHANYSTISQSYDQQNAPSYFAKKSNVFNVYFVKIGWFWITLAFLSLIFSHSSLGPPLRGNFTRRRIQALLRYAVVTATWVAVTQWFFGPPIIDRSFRWTGGKCEQIMFDDAADLVSKAERGDVKEVFTHAACKAIGGQWSGGHDISGHVFLLILGSAMLWLELLPAVLPNEGFRARRVLMPDGVVRRVTFDIDEPTPQEIPKVTGIGVQVALGVAALSWWMLLMTAAYFHTWFEKATGLLVAFIAIYAVYFLPRALPPWRQIVGMPGA